MKHKIKQFGYVSPIIESGNYLAGSLPKVVVNESGDWRPYCPAYEPQFRGFETNDCTIFGTENAIQMYLKCVFGVDVNYSERFVSNGMNRDNSVGQDPHLPLEWIRHNGVIAQDLLPMTDSLKEYQTPRPLPKHLLDEAKKWGYDLKHEYIFTNTPQKHIKISLLREYLTYSPVPLSVTAWREQDGLFVDDGKPNTHWAVLVHIDENDVMYVYDSYDLIVNGVSTALIKKLDPNHRIEVAKRIMLTPKLTEEKRNFFLRMLDDILEKLLGIKKQVDELAKNPIPEAHILTEVKPKPVDEPKYLWDTKERARHSVRLICDEEGLSLYEKDLITAVIQQESQFNIKAINVNRDNRKSIDYGICQYNSYWYIERMKLLTVKQALEDPEFCVRLMIQRYKQGFLKDWVAYSSGAYLKYMPK